MTDFISDESDERFIRLAQQIAPAWQLHRCWRLAGGVSAQVTALELEQADGQSMKLVVRQHGMIDLQHNPQIAADEFRLLKHLQSIGLPVPAPYYLVQAGEIFPVPCLVIEYVDGEMRLEAPVPDADLMLLAETLARIHSIKINPPDLNFLPRQTALISDKLESGLLQGDTSLAESRIREILKAIWPLPEPEPLRLLHGDFWPGNIIWRDNRIAAIIDWEDAALGDPLADLSTSRLETLWAFGEAAMRKFTRHYQSIMTTLDYSNLPYWDLCAALRPIAYIAEWGLKPESERRMRDQLRAFINEALGALPPQ